MRTYGMSDGQLDQVWAGLRAGESIRSIAHAQGVEIQHVRRFFEQTGGVRPTPRHRSTRHLTVVEREEISRSLAAGASARWIAARLDRSPATVSREIIRNGGREQYRAHVADQQAYDRARRPKASLSPPGPCCGPGWRRPWSRSGHRSRSAAG